MLGKKLFESLDEIIEQYVDPCNEVLYNAKIHPKYVSKCTLEELETIVKDLKAQDKAKIPYRFG